MIAKEYIEEDRIEFDKFLNNTYGIIKIVDTQYPSSMILKTFDPIRYDLLYNEFLNEKYDTRNND